MYKLLTKNGQLMALILGLGIIAISMIFIITGIDNAGWSTSEDLNRILKDNPGTDFGFFNFALYAVLALIVVAFIAAVIFGLIQLVSNFKGSIKGVIGFILVIVAFFVLTSMADTDFASNIAKDIQKFDITEKVSKFISGGISTTLLLLAVAGGSMILFELRNIFK